MGRREGAAGDGLASRLLPSLLLLLACTSSSPGPNGGDAVVRLRNQSGTTLALVFIRSCGAPAWGPDRLGATEVLPPGVQREFGLPGGCHELLTIAGVGGAAEFLDLQVRSGEVREVAVEPFETGGPPPPPANAGTIRLVNQLTQPIAFVHIRPCGAARWGPDQLDVTEVVAPAATREFLVAPPCADLLAVSEPIFEARRVTVASGQVTTVTATGTALRARARSAPALLKRIPRQP